MSDVNNDPTVTGIIHTPPAGSEATGIIRAPVQPGSRVVAEVTGVIESPPPATGSGITVTEFDPTVTGIIHEPPDPARPGPATPAVERRCPDPDDLRLKRKERITLNVARIFDALKVLSVMAVLGAALYVAQDRGGDAEQARKAAERAEVAAIENGRLLDEARRQLIAKGNDELAVTDCRARFDNAVDAARQEYLEALGNLVILSARTPRTQVDREAIIGAAIDQIELRERVSDDVRANAAAWRPNPSLPCPIDAR